MLSACLFFGLASRPAKADYYQQAVLLSADLLAGVSDEAWITGFTATSSVPASTTVGFLFSLDSAHWYNSRGEEGIWDTMASGTKIFDLRSFNWATSTLSTTSLSFYYKVRLTTNIATITPIVYDAGVEYSTTYNPDTASSGYYRQAVLLSADLFSGQSDAAWLTGFTATTSIPASTTLGFLFSNDQTRWFNHNGEEGVWDTVASGTTAFDLRSLDWATTTLATTSLTFYYKARLTTNIATLTPVLYEIRADYTDTYSPSPPTNGYFSSATLVSANLLAGGGGASAQLRFFGYNLDLPANTGASIQFGTTTDYWYSASGTLWATSTLLSGNHLATRSLTVDYLASSTALSLAALNWAPSAFYYKLTLTTANPVLTPRLSDIRLDYDSASSGPVLYFKFDEGKGTTPVPAALTQRLQPCGPWTENSAKRLSLTERTIMFH
jgi:hypothetical protein